MLAARAQARQRLTGAKRAGIVPAMPTDPLNVALAAAPPLTVLVLMTGLRMGGAKAGPAGWLVALLIAVLRFGAGGELLLYAHLRALVLTIDVVLIVWAALALYQVVYAAGALDVIARWFGGLTGDSVLRVLLTGWVFASFLQGVGGFGVPIAVTAPLLVGLGLSPLTAVIVPFIGHAWAVTFGSLGSSFIALIGVTGQPSALLAPPTAILLGLAAPGCGALAAHAAGGLRGLWRALPAVLVIGLVMAVVQYLVAVAGLWNIASACAGLAGLLTGLWVTRWRRWRGAGSVASGQATGPPLRLAIAPYVILIVLAVGLIGVQPVKAFLGQLRPSIHIPQLETTLGWVTPATPAPGVGIPLLVHTGSVLLYSTLLAFWLFRARGWLGRGAARGVLAGVRQKGMRPAIGILAMVAMATVMQNAGMTRTLAEWLSRAVAPDWYAVVGTLIGALGSFMTGSNTNSNAVFAGLQLDSAQLMGLSVSLVLALQTASAAIASMMAPAKILVGASTVGIGRGDEGRVLRSLLLYGAVLLAGMAAVAWLLLRAGY